MTSRWFGLPAGTDAAARLREMSRAREHFLASGRLGREVRAVVAESWRRSAGYRVAAAAPGPPVDLDEAGLDSYRQQHPVAELMPVIRRLLVQDAKDAGLIVAVTDEVGRLMWVEGAHHARNQATGMGFVEGALWSEQAAGTNAPGTALALGHAVQIFAAEHFADPVTAWSCAAAPLHDADGRLIGAIDLTGGDEVATPQSLTLVRAAASAVEAEARIRRLQSVRPPRRGAARSRSPRDAATSAPVATPRLRVLGRTRGELVTRQGVTPLRLRHAEILLLLATNRHGLNADQLAIELHEQAAAPVTLRAELSRLRDLLTRIGEPHLASRPYRLTSPMQTDAHDVRLLLQAGAYGRAVAAYPGSVLPDSVAPGVVALRELVRNEIRTCLIAAGDADLMWTYAQTLEARDDLELWEACALALPAASGRAPIAAARVQQLHRDLG